MGGPVWSCAAVLALLLAAPGAVGLSVRLERRPRRAARLLHESHPLVLPAPANGSDAVRGRTRQRRLGSMVQEVPIDGRFTELAVFYANAWVGTPPQLTTAIADTGSALMAVPCSDCTQCGSHMDPPPIDMSLSSTAARVPGGAFSQHYAEGDGISGDLWTDVVYLGAPGGVAEGSNAYYSQDRVGVPFKFGCTTWEGGLFKSQVPDGIIGMGFNSHDTSKVSFVQTLDNAGRLAQSVFGMCLTLNGGALTLGAIDTWVPFSKPSSTFYVVDVIDARLNDAPFQFGHMSLNSGNGVIVDSGTSFSYLPVSAQTMLVGAIGDWCRAGDGSRCAGFHTVTVQYETLCIRVDDPTLLDQPGAFPEFSFELKGATGSVMLTMKPRHLFLNMEWLAPKIYCLGVYSNNGPALIGANAMLGYDIIFDMGAKRLGVVPARGDCAPDPAFGVDGAPSVPPAASPSPSASAGSQALPDTDGSFLWGAVTALSVAAAACCCCLVAVRWLCRGTITVCGITVTTGTSPYAPVQTAPADAGAAAQGAAAIRPRRSGRRGADRASREAEVGSAGDLGVHDDAAIPAEPFRDASVGGHSAADSEDDEGADGHHAEIELVAGPSRTLPNPAGSVSSGSSERSFGDSDIDV
ncbi:hypothetical protein FNF29_04857 [Cafeteria roenbergensis]|uniref:Peptidase A1 domain-containing protein n=1 Tax=Cafeteria roenbergensis TaxID=33653 RepID=A0A5A8CEC7_CAFRO|nr:hypothetical protein FNF29_04857 [Cafeteria roenbergensis]|eukprot:KAA0150967.1 hypothetical protein FNF29_04857 [Cafeteria roenbergensis]